MNGTTNPGVPNDFLQQIDDIKGLRPVSPWPLADGWWVIIVVSVVVVLAVSILLWRRHMWRQSWKGEAAQSLSQLTSELGPAETQSVLAALSVIMRRIAVQKYSRIECAGLEGNSWLLWLEKHDPAGYKWSTEGQLLIHTPYAPPGEKIDPVLVSKLIAAAQQWVR